MLNKRKRYCYYVQQIHLNTTLVNVKLILLYICSYNHQHLNTTLVNVKQGGVNMKTLSFVI